MQNEYFPVVYQTKKGHIFTFCSSSLAKAKGPNLYKGSIGNTAPAQVQIVSVRGGLCCAKGIVGAGSQHTSLEITGSPGKFLPLSRGARVVQSNPLASGDSRAAQGLGGVV